MRLLVHRRSTIRNYRIIGGCGEFATYSRAALRLLCVRLGEVQGSSHEQEAYILHDAAATAASWKLPLTLPLLCLGALQSVSFRSLVTARACPSREHRRPVASRSARVLPATDGPDLARHPDKLSSWKSTDAPKACFPNGGTRLGALRLRL